MSTINERFREVRKSLSLSQDDFAARANRTRSEISNIEYNKTSPKEEVIKAVCSAHGISETWLKSGEGEMLLPPLDEETEYISALLDEVDNPLVDIIRAVMDVYMDLDPDDRERARAFAASFRDKIKENRG